MVNVRGASLEQTEEERSSAKKDNLVTSKKSCLEKYCQSIWILKHNYTVEKGHGPEDTICGLGVIRGENFSLLIFLFYTPPVLNLGG